MEIKNNIITLTEDEIRDLMIFQLRRIDDFCEDNEFQIRNRNGIWKGIDLETDSIKLFSKEADKDNPENKIVGIHKPQYIQQQLQELFYQYLEWKYNRNDTPLSLKTQIREILENEPTFLEKENRNHYPADLLHLYRKFKEVDAYAENRLNAIKGEPNIEPTTLQIQRLEALMNQKKEEDIKKGLQIKHSWKEICAKMLQPAKHSREIKKDTIDQKEKCLETIFELIDKEYIEQISDSDCEKVNELIYRVPKRWKITYPNRRLLDVLLPPQQYDIHPDGMSIKSISKYLTIFQEFLRYCRKKRYIDNDLSDLIDKPRQSLNPRHYDMLTDEDLAKTFNPATYPRQTMYRDDANFWIPLLSLFSGARLNEMAQIRLVDIKVEQGIYYIQTEGRNAHPQQSLKNPQSRRKIPIHPKLKDLGFLHLVQFQKKNKKDFLFTLNYSEKNGFGNQPGKVFNDYLREINVRTDENYKVFHSLRHTVRPKMRDEWDIPLEYIDILCGWENGKNAGAKTYAHKDQVPIKRLYEMICKIQYPFLDKQFEEMAQYQKKRSINKPKKQ